VLTAPAEAEKNVNGDFVLWLKLMNSPEIIGKNTAVFKSVKVLKLMGGLLFFVYLKTF
jgi:hypothetical protein